MLTEAVRGEGVDELWDAIESHRAYLERGAGGSRSAAARKLAAEVFALASARAKAHLEQAVAGRSGAAAAARRGRSGASSTR